MNISEGRERAELLRQAGFDELAELAAVGALAGLLDADLDGAHGRADVAGAEALAGEGFFDDGFELVFAEIFRQVALDDDDLTGFLRGQLGTIAFLELLDRIAALLDHGGENLLGLSIGKGGPFIDLAILEGGLDHAEGRGALGVAGFHGRDHIVVDLLHQVHRGLSRGQTFSL